MTRILVVADTPWVRSEVHAALTEPDTTIVDLDDPAAAAATVIRDEIDMVMVDMQVGSMGGMAVTRAIREHMLLNHFVPVPVIMLLDRSADGFLARRAGAAAWVVKPFTSQQLLDTFWKAKEREMPALDALGESALQATDKVTASDTEPAHAAPAATVEPS